MRTSQQAGFSKTVGWGLFFRTRPRRNAEGRIVRACKEFSKRRPIERSMVMSILHEVFKLSFVSRRIRLRGSRSQVHRGSSADTTASGKCCMDTYEPWSDAMGTSIIRMCTKIEGTECIFGYGGVAAVQAKPEDPDLSIGNTIALQSQAAPPPPPDRLHPGQMDSARAVHRATDSLPVIEEREKNKSVQLKSFVGKRRWYVVGSNERNSHKRKMVPKAFTRILRAKPHFHDVDGLSKAASHTENSGIASKHRPELHRRAVVGTTDIGIG